MSVIVGGKPFPRHVEGLPNVHCLRSNWPKRYAVCKGDVGWNRCELCQREHRVWMTSDAEWAKLPRRLRPKRLCVGCFRKHARQ